MADPQTTSVQEADRADRRPAVAMTARIRCSAVGSNLIAMGGPQRKTFRRTSPHASVHRLAARVRQAGRAGRPEWTGFGVRQAFFMVST